MRLSRISDRHLITFYFYWNRWIFFYTFWQGMYLANQEGQSILQQMLFFKNYALLCNLSFSPRKKSQIYYLYDFIHWKCIKILLQISYKNQIKKLMGMLTKSDSNICKGSLLMLYTGEVKSIFISIQ